MRALIVGLACVAACYSPSYRDCAIHCAGGTCPSGYTCDHDTMLCRGEGANGACDDASTDIDGPADDPDRDGILTINDNCPSVANPNQNDEDLDGLGDTCDPCPPFGTAADNMDDDGDGVGNGCDPSPMLLNNVMVPNKIVVFEGFADSTAPPGVSSVSPMGGWTFGGGLATAAGNIGNQPMLMTWPLVHPPGYLGEAVLARLTLPTVNTLRPAGAGVITQYSGPSGLVCWLELPDAANNGQLLVGSFPNVTGPNTNAPDPWSTSKIYSLDVTRRSATNVQCADHKLGTSVGLPQDPNSGPDAGLVALGFEARFEWVMIVVGQ